MKKDTITQAANLRRIEKVPTQVRHPFGNSPVPSISEPEADPEAGKGKPRRAAEVVDPPPEK